MKSLFDRALATTLTIVAIVLLLKWSWTMLRPMLPVLVGLVLVGCLIYLVLRRR